MIVFASRTGNVRYIVTEKLDLPYTELATDTIISEPFVLFTYTDGLGDVPKKVLSFMQHNDNYLLCKGVIASGNTNFNKNFCKSADRISEMYNIPILCKLDLRGQQHQFEEITRKYKEIME